MEETFLARFPEIAEKIFEQLKNEDIQRYSAVIGVTFKINLTNPTLILWKELRIDWFKEKVNLCRFWLLTPSPADKLSTTKSSNKLDKNNYKKMSSEESTEIDINIKVNNIHCTFNVRCLLNIEDIMERGVNVELRKNRDGIKMQLRFW